MAIFPLSESALVAAKRAILEHDAEEGDKKAKAALKLASDSGQFLAAIQIAITLVGFFSAMVASTTLFRSISCLGNFAWSA